MNVHSLIAAVGAKSAWIALAARLYAYGQAAVLAIAAALSWGTGSATVLHVASADGDVAAWRNPWPGTAGALVTLAAAASILGAWRMSRAKDRSWSRAGHAFLLAWGLYWLVGSTRASDASPDAWFVVAQVLSAIGFASQVWEALKAWPRRDAVELAPAPAPPAPPA